MIYFENLRYIEMNYIKNLTMYPIIDESSRKTEFYILVDDRYIDDINMGSIICKGDSSEELQIWANLHGLDIKESFK